MNLVIDDAVEVKLASKIDEEQRRALGNFNCYLEICESTDNIPGQILLKGDNVSLIQALQ